MRKRPRPNRSGHPPRLPSRSRRRLEHQPCLPQGRDRTTTYYRWKALQEDPVSNEQLRIAELESEVGRLKLFVAELGVRPPHAPGGLEKKAMTAPRRRLIVKELCEQLRVSRRCRVSGAGPGPLQPPLRTVLRDEQAALARRIEELARAHPRYGYRRIWALFGSRGLVGQQEGGSSHLASVGAEARPRRPSPSPADRMGRIGTPVISGRRVGRTTYGHGTLSSIVPATAVASSG